MFGKFGYFASVGTVILLIIKMFIFPAMPGWIVIAPFMIPFMGWGFCFILVLLWVSFLLSLRLGIDLLTFLFR